MTQICSDNLISFCLKQKRRQRTFPPAILSAIAAHSAQSAVSWPQSNLGRSRIVVKVVGKRSPTVAQHPSNYFVVKLGTKYLEVVFLVCKKEPSKQERLRPCIQIFFDKDIRACALEKFTKTAFD